jgi:hypothetical protein
MWMKRVKLTTIVGALVVVALVGIWGYKALIHPSYSIQFGYYTPNGGELANVGNTFSSSDKRVLEVRFNIPEDKSVSSRNLKYTLTKVGDTKPLMTYTEVWNANPSIFQLEIYPQCLGKNTSAGQYEAQLYVNNKLVAQSTVDIKN